MKQNLIYGSVVIDALRLRSRPSIYLGLIVVASILFVGYTYLMQGNEDEFVTYRTNMVEKQLKARGISDERVLEVMEMLPRHLFVDQSIADQAYSDRPLPIAEGQTISQPYVVALMTESLDLDGTERVLEIGTGSGYQAAVLAELCDEVFSVEIREGLTESAKEVLASLGYDNVRVKCADGYYGWEEYAPFDAIIITCAVNHVPPNLLRQLKDGGRLILPLGSIYYYQTLTLIEKLGEDLQVTYITRVAFVPMIGEALETGGG